MSNIAKSAALMRYDASYPAERPVPNTLRHEAAEECIGDGPATGLKIRERQEPT
jgi:hypothetical protein